MTSRKILVPLASLLAAGAVAVGSGATFTSSTSNTISSVASGTLSQTNSKANAAIFSLTDIKPGDTVNGTLTITNTGSQPADFGLSETSSANTFGSGDLSLVITNTTTNAVVYNGEFGGLEDNTRQALGVVQPGEANSYRFSVTLAQNAPNSDQGKTATAGYTWDSVQLSGTTTNQ